MRGGNEREGDMTESGGRGLGNGGEYDQEGGRSEKKGEGDMAERDDIDRVVEGQKIR